MQQSGHPPFGRLGGVHGDSAGHGRGCARSIRESGFAVEPGVRVFGGVELPGRLRDSPTASCAIDREDGPPVAVLVTEMHQQGLSIVLDPQPMVRVALLVKDPRPGVFASATKEVQRL